MTLGNLPQAVDKIRQMVAAQRLGAHRGNSLTRTSAADVITQRTRAVRAYSSSPFLAMLMLLVLFLPRAWGQDLDELGGVVIAQLPTGGGVKSFIGSPSIAIMEDGTYLASHDIFGEEDLYETRVFRSTDKGQSWTGVSTIPHLTWATLFTHGGLVYIMGESREGNNVVRESVDQGNSWGAVHVIGGNGTANGTPSPPVIHNDRIWFAASGRGAMTAALSESVLDPAAWKYTGKVDTSTEWLNGTFTYWTEGQIVASPHTGVVVLPKTHGLPYTGLIRVSYHSVTGEDGEAKAEFDPDTGFARLPGAEKKFACVYDAVSEKFYALTSPVLSVHLNDPRWPPELIRNAGAVFSSTDLKTWRVEKIVLYSPNIDYEAFQYFNFVIDGDDLAVVSRTALRVGFKRPPRGHDSNILSFYRIKNFRQLSREQVLVADTNKNRVLRYEANLTPRLAPLGSFDQLNQTAMTKPMGVAQSPDGDVYISEQISGGRVLRFSATGRVFKGVIATEGVDFTGWPESLAFGEEGYLFMTVALGPDSDKIYRIDPSTKRVTLVVPSSFSSSAGRGTLRDPHGIALGPDGRLYVADRGNDKIRIFFRGTDEFLGDLTSQPSPLALALHPSDQFLLFSHRKVHSPCRQPCYTDDVIAAVYPGGEV
jgi:hypothetical protein